MINKKGLSQMKLFNREGNCIIDSYYYNCVICGAYNETPHRAKESVCHTCGKRNKFKVYFDLK